MRLLLQVEAADEGSLAGLTIAGTLIYRQPQAEQKAFFTLIDIIIQFGRIYEIFI